MQEIEAGGVGERLATSVARRASSRSIPRSWAAARNPPSCGGAEKIVQTSVDDEAPRAISLRTLQLPGDIREPRAPLGEVYHLKGATRQRAEWAAGRETIADDGDAGDGGS